MRGTAIVVISALFTGVVWGQVRTETVTPVSTDPAITGWTAAHGVAYSTAVVHPNPGKLFIYMHGQGGAGSGAMELLKTAAEEGYFAIGVTYPNDWQPFNLCTGSGDVDCAEKIRREIIDGTDRSALVAVSRTNSLENRVIKLLAKLDALHPGEGWGQFVVNGEIQWSRVTVWGHSQGGGNAGVLARNHAVERACVSAPAADGGPGSPAAWWAVHATPAGSYFGFCHTQDQLSTKVAFWDALGMGALGAVTDVATSSTPFGNTHELSTSVAPAVAGQYHNSVVADGVTPRDAGNVPVYKPAWRYMMTAPTSGGGTAQGRVWDEVTFANVPTFSGTVDLKMDVYEASSGAGARPLVVWVHGGGWQSGSHNEVPSFALALRSRGVSVASIDYRLSGDAVFPAQVHDCKGAIRFLRAHAAEYNIDPARVAVWGSSAGGHLAALLAMSNGGASVEGATGGNMGESSAVMACAAFYPPTDLLNMQPDCDLQTIGCSFNHDAYDSPESALLGVNQPGQGVGWLRANIANPAAPFPALAAQAGASNPVAWVDRGDVPLYLAHGDADRVAPLNGSLRLRDAALAGGGAVTLVVVPGAVHGSLGTAASDAGAQWVGDVLLGVLVPVTVTSEPVAVTVCPGAGASFSVGAGGTGPLSYSWRRNGAALSDVPGHVTGSHGPVLALAGAGGADAGVYDCLVSNGGGTRSSAGAQLAVVTSDVGSQGGAHGGDGVLDNNDFVVFIDLFFSHAAGADVGRQGGIVGSDGAWDNNDFVVFVDRFFTGC
jgi:acetyl esterase/lipase